MLGHADPVLDLIAGAGGLNQRQPVAARRVARTGENLNDIPVSKLGFQRHNPPVHFGPGAGVAHLCVNRIGKINGSRFPGKDDHLPFGREGIDLFGIEVDLQSGEKLARVAHVALPFHQMAQPGEPCGFLLGHGLPVLILPVGCDALLGQKVHLLGANLHLEGLTVRPDHRSVQGLVHIGPGNGDEILDAARDRSPGIVDDSQGGIAVFHLVGDDADRQQVIHLIEGNPLALQLLVEAVDTLDAPFDPHRNLALLHPFFHQGLHLGEESLSRLASIRHVFLQLLESFRFEITKCQILQFPAHFAHSQAVGDGGINFHRFARRALPSFRREELQGAHVVKPVSQFHQDDPDVVHHGQHHLAVVFRLVLLAAVELDAADFGDALHKTGYLAPELLRDSFGGRGGVFHHVVQHSRHDAGDV